MLATRANSPVDGEVDPREKQVGLHSGGLAQAFFAAGFAAGFAATFLAGVFFTAAFFAVFFDVDMMACSLLWMTLPGNA